MKELNTVWIRCCFHAALKFPYIFGRSGFVINHSVQGYISIISKFHMETGHRLKIL